MEYRNLALVPGFASEKISRMKRWLLISIALVPALGGAIAWMRMNKQQEGLKKADLAPLRQQLEIAAEKALPLPTLGGWRVELTVRRAQFGPRIGALIRLAENLGGTAQRGLDRDDGAVVLVRIPENAQAVFAENAREFPLPPAVAPVSLTGEFSEGEVVLHSEEKNPTPP